uniref:Exoskeleton beta-chitin-specific binding protein n=1 Tax=Riftia pachyptila TaxID=6426 RepID=Q9NB50_RIFPA|nr:exoskeleton beta-chitin-specific binding protein [Riftia pachyptila]
MSKFIVALLLACVAVSVQGCGDPCEADSCSGLADGKYPSMCGPCSYYYKCIGLQIYYFHCQKRNYCIVNGLCRPCGDSCEGKPDGVYPSVNRPRPAYYQCEAGQLYYRTCQPFQVFNPWCKRCECFEGSCLHGDGWRASFCRGAGWRVFCEGGFAKSYKKCPVIRPHVCCRTYTCVSTCVAYSNPNRCCSN